MADPARWGEWAQTILAGVLGILSGIVGMITAFAAKFSAVHARINKANARINQHDTQIAVLMAHHHDNLKFQERCDRSFDGLTKKNDQQLNILLELKGEAGNHHQRGA